MIMMSNSYIGHLGSIRGVAFGATARRIQASVLPSKVCWKFDTVHHPTVHVSDSFIPLREPKFETASFVLTRVQSSLSY